METFAAEVVRVGGRRQIPLLAWAGGALAVSLFAVSSLAWPGTGHRYSTLPWLFALVPPFLFATYRGWIGAAFGLAAGLGTLLVVVVVEPHVFGPSGWRVPVSLAVGLTFLSLGAGAVGELLQREQEHALGLAYVDSLTGLPNRHMLEFFLEKTFAGAQRGTALALVMWDLDGFKAFNDANGHRAGDAALREVGRILAEESPPTLVTGRFGGDEFLSILPGDDGTEASRLTRRIRTALAADARLPGGAFAISAGVAVYDDSIENVEDLVAKADRDLYRNKGRADAGSRRAPLTS